MTKKRSKHILTLLLLALLLCGCHKPADSYAFITIQPQKVESDYEFIFKADLSDSTKLYCSRIVCKYDPQIITSDHLSLSVRVVSPSGKEYAERVEMPFTYDHKEIEFRKSTADLYDISWPYRDNISSKGDAGLWEIVIAPTDKQMLKGIYGMGFSISTTK